jgi:4-phospho-D-threonate 3-dehydrogenase / 4-phospho-D-erythronate 3-dehydrogenase
MNNTANKTDKKAVIGVTIGDPAGIGPEVVAGALQDRELVKSCRLLIIGEKGVMERALGLYAGSLPLRSDNLTDWITGNSDAPFLLDLHNIDGSQWSPGKVCAAAGRASAEYIIKAADLALDHTIKAIVTAPINKESTRAAGYGELGHLEMLAKYTGSREYATMLVSENLRVVHLTTHYPLKEALNRVKKDYILARVILTQKAFTGWGYARPVIGVAALNPHGGENGIIGDEEIKEIIPAVKAAQEMGIDARGPYPADTIFNRALNGEMDAVIALYHDQGHIAIKVHNVKKSISIALGLPFIRTSVDHGTAYDIAWQGKADATSLKEAIGAAIKLVTQQRL